MPAPSGGAWTPQQTLEAQEAYWSSSAGQREIQAYEQTNAFNRKQILEGLKIERDKLAITKGVAEANAWYQQQQVKLAQAEHELSLKKVEAEATGYWGGVATLAREQAMWGREITEANLTGAFKGVPTFEAQRFEVATTAYYQGNPTFERQQFETQQGGYLPGGAPTLANQAQQANYLGTYNGQQTQQAINQQQQYGLQVAQQSGYLGNNPTLEREQAAANIAMQAAGLGAQLQGPRNWANYLQGSYDVANSPAAGLASSVPGGLGAASNQSTQRLTLRDVLGDFGMTGQPSSGGGQAGIQPQEPMLSAQPVRQTSPFEQVGTGGPSYFNEGAAPGGDQRMSIMPVGQPQRQRNPNASTDQMVNGTVLSASSAPIGASLVQPGSVQGGATGANLGLNPTEEATLRHYYRNPNQAPVGFFESKSKPQRQYMAGIAEHWGEDPDTIDWRYANSRPRQGGVRKA